MRSGALDQFSGREKPKARSASCDDKQAGDCSACAASLCLITQLTKQSKLYAGRKVNKAEDSKSRNRYAQDFQHVQDTKMHILAWQPSELTRPCRCWVLEHCVGPETRQIHKGRSE